MKTIPAFGLFFSPYCGHCAAIHPTWENVSDLYADDPKVIAFECDTANVGEYCHKLASLTGVPHFVKYIRGEGTAFSVERTYDGINEVFKSLKKFDPEVTCKTYPLHLGDYPAIVYSTKEKPKKACAFLQKVKTSIPGLRNHLYYEKLNETEYPNVNSRLTAYFSANNTLELNDTITLHSVTEFLRTYGLSLFGNWYNGFESAKNIKRRLGFIVQDGKWRQFHVKGLVENYQKDIAFSQISQIEFNKCYPDHQIEPQNLPALGFANEKKNRFFLMENVTKSTVLEEFLEELLKGKLEGTMEMPLDCLYELTKQKKEEKRKAEKEKMKKLTPLSKIFIIGIIISLFVIGGLLVWINSMQVKPE